MELSVYIVNADKSEVRIWSDNDFKPSATEVEDIVEQCLNVAIVNAIGKYFPYGFGMSTQHMRADSDNEELILVHCSGRNYMHEWQVDGNVKVIDRSVPDRDFVVSIIKDNAALHKNINKL